MLDRARAHWWPGASEREFRMMRRRARPGLTRVAGLVAVAGLTGRAAVSAPRGPFTAFLSRHS
jgi:hypothetical protein